MTMHNEEGQLLEKVFHRLLSVGVMIISLAVLVWFVWAIVRTCEITDDASQPRAPAGTSSSMQHTPAQKPPLAHVRITGPEGNPGKLIKLCFRPVASFATRIDRCLDRLPGAVAVATEDAAFFTDGPL